LIHARPNLGRRSAPLWSAGVTTAYGYDLISRLNSLAHRHGL